MDERHAGVGDLEAWEGGAFEVPDVGGAEIVAAEAPEAEAPPEEEGPQPEKPSLDALRERLSGNPQVSAQLRALMEMAYADLFAGLDLDPDTKAALRDLLLASQLEQVALANYAMELGDVGYGEQNEWIEDERAMLAAQLKELLSPEDYAAWEGFMAEMAALRDSDTLYTAAESMLYQIRAMARMRERLLLLPKQNGRVRFSLTLAFLNDLRNALP